MKPRKPDESDERYIKRLEDQNRTLQQRVASTDKWAQRLNEAVMHLSCEASIAFQAMAEKAGVRGHPSVTAAVKLFDMVSHPQYRGDGEPIPKIEFPSDWDFDRAEQWGGDADMALNSPVADVIEFLNHLKFSLPKKDIQRYHDVIDRLQDGLRKRIDGVKEAAGFKPKHLAPAPLKHFRDMSKEELFNIVSALGWMALDLGQDMAFANEMLRRDLRAATYRRVCGDLYAMSQFAIEPAESNLIDIKVFGAEVPI